MLAKARSFNVDVSTKLCLSRGKLVNLLISSNIARYLEFKSVDEALIFNGRTFEIIPCSKQGLLLNSSIPLRDKRVLSKFIQHVVQFSSVASEAKSEGDGSASSSAPPAASSTSTTTSSSSASSSSSSSTTTTTTPAFGDLRLPATASFKQLLEAASLSRELQAYVLHAMAGVGGEVPWEEGVRKMQVFLQSIGVHGPTPFIASLYGCGEFPQAFCRLCAVFGGVYMLGTRTATAFSEDGAVAGVDTAHGRMCAPVVVLSAPPSSEHVVFRAVLIVEGECGRKDNASVVTFPPLSLGSNSAPVAAVVLGPGVQACPDGMRLVHLTMHGLASRQAEAHAVLERAARTFARWPGEQAVPDHRGAAVYAIFFQLPQPAADASAREPSGGVGGDGGAGVGGGGDGGAPSAPFVGANTMAPGIHYINDYPDSGVDFQSVTAAAAAAFARLLPGEDFLPAAPNPEDVVWGGEEEEEEGKGEEEGKKGEEAGKKEEVGKGETVSAAPEAAVNTGDGGGDGAGVGAGDGAGASAGAGDGDGAGVGAGEGEGAAGSHRVENVVAEATDA